MSRRIAALAVVFLLSALTVPAAAADCDRMAFGLTEDQRLVKFSSCRPGRALDLGSVVGIQAPDSALVGIDFRVKDGLLYGVGNAGGIYTIDTAAAVASRVSSLTVPLEGASFGVDFNPAADRLRIVSDTGQNLRHNLDAGGVTVADTSLSYTPGTPATGVVGAAYTNNDLDPLTGTTLFDLDSVLDQISLQSPPNNGSLVATGKLGSDAGVASGFDIVTRVSRTGRAAGNDGYAVITVEGMSVLHRVNLLTGEMTRAGAFRDTVTDIALAIPGTRDAALEDR